jgi:hypothetical protein
MYLVSLSNKSNKQRERFLAQLHLPTKNVNLSGAGLSGYVVIGTYACNVISYRYGSAPFLMDGTVITSALIALARCVNANCYGLNILRQPKLPNPRLTMVPEFFKAAIVMDIGSYTIS